MTARGRRHIHAAVAIVWIGPGAGMSYLFMHSIAWVVFMSWFANVYACIAALSGETPVEEE